MRQLLIAPCTACCPAHWLQGVAHLQFVPASVTGPLLAQLVKASGGLSGSVARAVLPCTERVWPVLVMSDSAPPRQGQPPSHAVILDCAALRWVRLSYSMEAFLPCPEKNDLFSYPPRPA